MENVIENWVNTDKSLYNLILEIEALEKPINEQAEIAFEKLSKLYNIPRMPDDIIEDDNSNNENANIFEPRSLFEEHAYLKFLAEPGDDPRATVLLATYQILNNYQVDLEDVAEKEFGDKIPNECQIGIIGEGYNAEVIFPQKESKSWFELGCKIMTKIG